MHNKNPIILMQRAVAGLKRVKKILKNVPGSAHTRAVGK